MSRAMTVIAEIAQAHDGSLGTAHAYVDAVADAKADAIKFQCHIAAEESTPSEPWRIKFSPQDETRYEYWKRMEFSSSQWRELKSHCDERRLEFICSPFSVAAVELLEGIGVERWKVASGEVRNAELLGVILETGKPLLVSTGMSPWPEIDEIVDQMRSAKADFSLFQCTSQYPTPPEHVGLNVLGEMRERYGCPVGLSDHSGQIYAGLAAAALGAEFLELHTVFSRQCFGPDVSSSITLEELSQLVEGVRAISRMRANHVDKSVKADELSGMRKLFMRSVVTRSALPAGAVLGRGDLACKKPGTGIPGERLSAVVGRRLKVAVAADHVLMEDELE